jgi:hypothetical protein
MDSASLRPIRRYETNVFFGPTRAEKRQIHTPKEPNHAYTSSNTATNTAPHSKNAALLNRSESPYQQRTTQRDNPTQQLIKQAVDFLIQQLEAGKSETLTAYLAAMARFQCVLPVSLRDSTRVKLVASVLSPAWAGRTDDIQEISCPDRNAESLRALRALEKVPRWPAADSRTPMESGYRVSQRAWGLSNGGGFTFGVRQAATAGGVSRSPQTS